MDLTIRQWVERYERGEFSKKSRSSIEKAGWGSWPWKASEVPAKAELVYLALSKLKDGGKVDLDRMKVRLNGVMPASDDPCFVSLSLDGRNGQELVVDIGDRRSGHWIAVYSKANGFGKPVFTCCSYFNKLAEWLNRPW